MSQLVHFVKRLFPGQAPQALVCNFADDYYGDRVCTVAKK